MNSTTETIGAAHFIGGEWMVGERTEQRFNPAQPAELVSLAPDADESVMSLAIEQAQAAQAAWAAMPAQGRGEILAAAGRVLAGRAPEVATLLAREEGKTLAEAEGEVDRAVRMLTFYAAQGWQALGATLPSSDDRTHLYTTREPVGTVGVITPWNFPLAIPVWKAGPALVAGNTIVLKPSSFVPATTQALLECFIEAGIPRGVLNVVHGSGSRAGQALVDDPRVAAVSFTGSTAVGRGINLAAAARMARVQLEMGGKNAVVVLPDADAERAADICVRGAFGLTGQACTATSRVIVTRADEHRMLNALAARAAAIVTGDPLDPRTSMGPVVTDQQLSTDLGYIERALTDGADVVTGGTASGRFLEPTILRNVDPDSALARQEVFGPVLSVLVADSPDDALHLLNDTEYGLSAGIVTDDLSAAMNFAGRADAGVIKINRQTTGTDVNAPFGGNRSSSNGLFREQGFTATDFFTRVKTVYLGY
ncbi:aldehyde dehydrogenase family protein [Microbacterium sp. SSM24]|uniref:aldehyde dehydrogenase family protein n=1 Tax=Microbacterium sp. SSM24 TaxID=2991714 RepID=UPI002227D72A|nr:aldehyde dehydrogenase family protein [Microbacterium sp. SSM24]MCW3493367.1 aldehyde dehydrogenase family protein [Microbacterium sp. SSM24]